MAPAAPTATSAAAAAQAAALAAGLALKEVEEAALLAVTWLFIGDLKWFWGFFLWVWFFPRSFGFFLGFLVFPRFFVFSQVFGFFLRFCGFFLGFPWFLNSFLGFHKAFCWGEPFPGFVGDGLLFSKAI